MNYEYGLMDDEIITFEKFRKRHSNCNTKRKLEMLKEGTFPTFHIIDLRMSTVGMIPSVKCLMCGRSEDIACNERLLGE